MPGSAPGGADAATALGEDIAALSISQEDTGAAGASGHGASAEGASVHSDCVEASRSPACADGDAVAAARLQGIERVIAADVAEADITLEQTPVLDSFDLEGIAKYIQERKARNIVCMCGAGISVSAGIPDFRTPGSGLYDNLQRYDLPYPQAVFEMEYFQHRPEPFFMLAKELMPGKYKPTPTHHFIKLLHDKGVLLRCYTQNIDSLETATGLPAKKVIAAHGNFDSASCIKCKLRHNLAHVRKAVDAGEVCRCKGWFCEGIVKPDIVFFGESLPSRFFHKAQKDLPKADLLIILGTSLVVYPFAGLKDQVDVEVPRLLVNREEAGVRTHADSPVGLWFGEGNRRDALFLGDCDAGVAQLAELLGWAGDLRDLVARASPTVKTGLCES